MTAHPQTWVKVNATVDQGVAEIVLLLSRVEGLQTVDSCQGEGDRLGHVYFYYGDWQAVSALLFGTLAPQLAHIGEDVRLSVEIFNGSGPMAALRFHPASASAIAAALLSTGNPARAATLSEKGSSDAPQEK